MRRAACALMMILVLSLTACGGREGNEAEELVQRIRGEYLAMTACGGHGQITADYGQRVYRFEVDFSWEREGEMLLTLTGPEDIAGTRARIAAGETALEYDGVAVETGPLDSAGRTPIDALPALLEYARCGYLAECVLEAGEGASQLHVTCREPEKEPGQGMEAQLWFDSESGKLTRGEISEDGYTVIQCDITGFEMTQTEKNQ